MPYDPDDHPGPTKARPPEPEGEPMVGKPNALPDDPTNALHNSENCISFAAAARRKRRFAPRSLARAPLTPAAPPVVVVLATQEMRLRFGIKDRIEAPGGNPTDDLS